MKKYILLMSMVVTGCLHLIAQPVPPSSFTGFYQIGVSPSSAPTVSSTAAATITASSASLGGNVTADGGASVTEKGVVYSSSDQTPEIGENGVTKNDNGTGTGTFSETISGLTGSTTYYFRAYAINSAGTSYGSVLNFTTSAPYSGGSGTSNDPYKIATLADLVYLSEHTADWNGYFKQTADIDASATTTMNSNGSGGYYGFSPIGNASTWFGGAYDGNEFRITNLYINRPLTNYVGLFGYIASWGSEFKNLGVDSADITGNNYVGAFFGYSNWPTMSPAMAGAYIHNIYTSGSVAGNQYVGGFCGYVVSWVQIQDCYTRCSVSGNNYLGGFISNSYGSYYHCYAAAVVAVKVNSGPFDATGTSGYYDGCFYDSEIAGNHTSSGYGSINSSATTTTNMKTQSTFTNASWDFEVETVNGINDYWKMSGTTNDGYPAFTWQPASTSCVMTASISSQSNVSCNGGSNGSLTVTPASGTSPYTYLWSSGGTAATKTGLAAGTYTVTVTDANSCTATASSTITQPATALGITFTSTTNVACNGASTGSLTATTTGGTANYTYQWSHLQTKAPVTNTSTQSSLAAGTYTVTVTDANSCTSSVSTTVTQPTAVTASTTPTATSCNGGSNGSIDLTPGGGTSPYTYAWSNGGTLQDLTGLAAGTYSVTITDANACTKTTSAIVTQPAALQVSTQTQTNVACNGGSTGAVTVLVSGGTEPFSYEWSNQANSLMKTISTNTSTNSNLAANTYTVTVTDGHSCTTTYTVTITEPTVLEGEITAQTNVACNGASTGSLTVTASGGTGDYNYSWSNQQVKNGFTYTSTNSNLAAGTYTVTITDANSCTVTVTETITQPTAVTASTTPTGVSCNGGSNGSIDLTPGGGTSPYTYAWSNAGTTQDLTGLAAGTYSVTITDANACTKTTSGIVTQPAALQVSTQSQTNVACNGGSTGAVTVLVSGGTEPFSYEWSNQANGLMKTISTNTSTNSNLAANTYTVTVTDNHSCTSVYTVTITEPTVLEGEITAQTNVACNGASTGSLTVTASGGTGDYNFDWSNQQIKNGFTYTSTNSNLAAGTYTVTITDANSCTVAVTETITQPTAVTASTTPTGVSCNGGSNGSIDLTPGGGTSPYTYAWSNAGTTQDLTGLAAGTYSVTITDANACTKTTSAIVTQPAALQVSTQTQTNVACNGGSTGAVTVLVSGGTEPFSYEWSNQANGLMKTISTNTSTNSNLVANTYTVTVTDYNSCTSVYTVTITEPTVLEGEITAQTNVACNGASTGSLTVTASGGTGDYNFDWSNQQIKNGFTYTSTNSNLAAGEYTVTITDANSCTVTVTETITEPDALEVSVASQTNVSCNGLSDGTVTVLVEGGVSPYQYVWSDLQTINKMANIGSPTKSDIKAGIYTVTVTDLNACTITYSVTITEPDELVVDLSSQTNVSCYGGENGSITVTVSGGTANYAYEWSHLQTLNKTLNYGSPTASSLSAGEYTVTVTDDHGCTDTYTTTVTEPDALEVSNQSQTNVSCNGGGDGTVTVLVSGGTIPYNYEWSNQNAMLKLPATTSTNSNLTAGEYTVTVTDDHSCTSVYTVTITEPTVLEGEITAQTNVACNGASTGSLTVTASGGTGDYNFDWSNQQIKNGFTYTSTNSNLAAGEYTVTITDANSCTVTVTETITEPDALEVSVASQTNVSCNGLSDGTVTVLVEGGVSPYQYVWSDLQTINKMANIGSPTKSDIKAGIYTVTVTDLNACTITYSVTITEPDELVVDLSSQTNVSCYGGENGSITVTVSGGTANYAYEWSHLQTLNKTLNYGSPTASSLSAGEYTVTVTDDHGCTDTYTTTVTEPDALEVSNQSQTNVSCNGLSNGSVTVSVIGGTPNYIYQWSTLQTLTKAPAPGTPTSSNLAAGNYRVIVIDSHVCRDTLDVTITEPDELTASITSQTNVSCWSYSDGEATVTAQGGTTPYYYQWSGGTPMAKFANSHMNGMMVADDYTVTVTDANSCTVIVDFTITEPDEITADAGIDQQICYDGTVTLAGSYTVAGGAIWSGGTGTFDPDNTTMNAVYTPSADEIAAGTLTLTLTTTDNGPCNEAIDEMEITIYPEPRWTYLVNGEEYMGTTMEFCYGTTVNAVATNFIGTYPIEGDETYYYNNQVFYNTVSFSTSDLSDLSGAMDLPVGAWELAFTNIVDAHGCVARPETMELFSLKAQINPNPTAIIESNDPICVGTELELSGVYDEIFCMDNCDVPQGYCESYSSIGNYQYISNFKLNNTRNLSGEGTYTLYNQESFKTLYIDSTYQVTITISGPMNYPHYNMVYVDWNRDGDFEDASEGFEIGEMNGIGSLSNTITVPSTAVMGQTMLRVINRKNSYAPSCGNYPVGETEDYLIDIKSVNVNSIVDYAWSGPSGIYNGKYWTINSTLANDDGLYSLTVTNTHGCTTSTEHQVIVSNPQVDFSAYDLNQEAPFAIGLNPGTFETYTWSDGSTQSSLLVNDFGTYSVTVSEYDCIDSESITFNEVQYITLDQGWDMFSTYINQTADIANVLSAFTNSVHIVKNNAGQTYWPAMNINGIHNMVIGQGYQIKMYNTETLTIEGISVNPLVTPIQLNQGINMIGMLRHNPVSAADLFAPVVQQLVYVKLNNGMVYLPQYQVNQVVTMYPDDAFKVMMYAAGSITYPANMLQVPDKEEPILNEPMYYPALASTGSDMTLVIPKSVLSNIVRLGDELAVYSIDGLLVGTAVYADETIAMPIWGQDKTRATKSGLSNSEGFMLEMYNHQSGEITPFETIEFELGDGTFHENTLAVVKSLNLNLKLNLSVYPNPVVDNLNVDFILSDASDSRIDIYNGLGQLVYTKLIQSGAGQHTERIAVSGFSSGIYTLRLMTQGELKEASFVVR